MDWDYLLLALIAIFNIPNNVILSNLRLDIFLIFKNFYLRVR